MIQRSWSGPSPGGRRLALERKFRLNIAAYGGQVSLLTLTAPGNDVLPFDTTQCKIEGPHKCDGRLGCKVDYWDAYCWNQTAQARASRLFEAAQRSADRFLVKVHKIEKNRLPRQLGNVGKTMQLRGVYHFHWLLPSETFIEKQWSRHIVRYMHKQVEKDAADPHGAQALVQRESLQGEITPGRYAFGFVKGGRAQHAGVAGSDNAAKYMARNAATYVAHQADARHYVSSRLTRATGVTMRALRGVNYLYVRAKLIAAGELEDSVIPTSWSEDRTREVLRVQAMLAAPGAP